MAGGACAAPSVAVIERAGAGTPIANDDVLWNGRVWRVTSGRTAGVAPADARNVNVDAAGNLRLRIDRTRTTATAAEVFSRDRLGYGTYQWWVEGPVDRMDPAVVLGLFLYGPAQHVGVDGENEIDVEFSRWNGTLCHGRCNANFTVYPRAGHRALGRTHDDVTIGMGNRRTLTARVTWTPTEITAVVLRGLQSLGVTTQVMARWTFRPMDPARLPVGTLPVGMNLWCVRRCPAASQEVTLRDFQFVPRVEVRQRVQWSWTGSDSKPRAYAVRRRTAWS